MNAVALSSRRSSVPASPLNTEFGDFPRINCERRTDLVSFMLGGEATTLRDLV
jgi:hypothetical protein